MTMWLTKRNLKVLNAVLFCAFLATLVAVGVPLVAGKDAATTAAGGSLRSLSGGVSSVQESVQNPHKEAALAKILQRNLFDAQLIDPPSSPPLNLPPLPWQLVGVTLINSQRVAIIRDTPKKAEYFLREGDEVEGYFGVRVMQITLTPPSLTYNRPLVGDVVLTMAGARPPGQQDGKRGWSDVIANVAAGQVYAVKVSHLGERIGDVEAYLETLQIEQAMEGTQPNGLRIVSLQEDSFLYAAGLRQGDIVKTVNGKGITDKDSAPALLAEASKASVLRVGIERNRRAQTLSYALLVERVR
jgi:type II secretory pathway component PulC